METRRQYTITEDLFTPTLRSLDNAHTLRPCTCGEHNVVPVGDDFSLEHSIKGRCVTYAKNAAVADSQSHDLQHLSIEDQQLFRSFGFGPTEEPRVKNIHQAIEANARKHPEEIAVQDQYGSTFTYGELDVLSSRLAALLIDSGVQQGDIIPLFLERSLAMVVGIVGVLKAGAAYAPQHVGVAPDTQLQFVANSTGCNLVLSIAKFKHKLTQLLPYQCVAIDTFINAQLDNATSTDQATPEAIAYRRATSQYPHSDTRCIVLFTSGTTGNPNGVQVTHCNLCNLLLTKPGNLGIKRGTRVAQILSISFDMASWEILGCLSNSGTLLIRGKNIADTARLADVIVSTPTILGGIDSALCTRVKTVAVAGEPCPRSLADEWARQCNFYNCCGPTETTIVNTMQLHAIDAAVLSIGKPTPNNTVYILDDQRKPCAIGETGEMWAGGDCVSAGYLNNPELTAQRYQHDPFRNGEHTMFNTRDLGRWTSNGELEHLGRTDDQVKVRGFRVELDSVSASLEAMPACERAVTLKLDNLSLVAFVAPLRVDTDEAIEAVSNALPYYCIPKFVLALPDLPKTDRGKIDKRVLLKIARAVDAGEMVRPTLPPGTGKTVTEQSQTSCAMKALSSTEIQLELPVEHPTHTVLTDSQSDKNASPKPLPHPYTLVELPHAPNTLTSKLTEHRFYHYWRLFAATAFVNLAFLVYGLTAGQWWSAHGIALVPMMNMVVANIAMAILIRQQYVVNVLFALATSLPQAAPLSWRRLAGKVYHFGGLHIGGAIVGTVWLFIVLGSMMVQAASGLPGTTLSATTMIMALMLLVTLCALVVLALPVLRQQFHNQFEKMHRFGGWFSLALFWAFNVSFSADAYLTTQTLAAQNDTVSTHSGFAYFFLNAGPSFWVLLLVTFSIVLPWLRLKRVPVVFERPSNHVVVAKFDYGVTPFAGSSTTISRSPWVEWHSFANVPAPGASGYRLTISRAGDWTGKLIDDLPSHLWVKGIPTAGVGNVDKLFRRVVWIATGSGIGPTLPHLLARQVPAHLVWSTRNARTTYGDEMVDEILEVEPDALIWDTDTLGRPDLVQLAYAAVQSFDAEAVIVISNEKLTRMVVHGMESRGIPAFGAIWDS